MATDCDPTEQALRALRDGDWSSYRALAEAAIDGDEQDFFGPIAALHPVNINIFNVLLALDSDVVAEAFDYLLPTIGRLLSVSLGEAEQYLDFVRKLGEGGWSQAARQLVPHVRAAPLLAQQLGESLKARELPLDSADVVWAQSYAAGAPAEAFMYLRRLSLDEPRSVAQLSLLVLSLETSDVEPLASLQEPISRALLLQAPVVGHTAWSALCQLAERSPAARNGLKDALDAGDPRAAIAILRFLLRDSTDENGSPTGESVSKTLANLVKLAISDASIRVEVDSALAYLLHRQRKMDAVVGALVQLGAHEEDATLLFGQLTNTLPIKPTPYARVLTAWLLYENVNFDSLKSLISAGVARRTTALLDQRAFAGATTEQRFKAARRVLGLTHHGPTLCKFAEAILEMTSLGDERLVLGEELLHLVYAEYPGAMEEFLKSKRLTFPKDSLEGVVYRSLYASALAWRRVLQRLPVRRELHISDKQRQILGARSRRIQRVAMRTAHRGSVFYDMVNHVNIAQGHKFASHFEGGAPVITELRSMSHSVELPSSERADPMRGLLERMQLRKDGR